MSNTLTFEASAGSQAGRPKRGKSDYHVWKTFSCCGRADSLRCVGKTKERDGV